MTPPRITDAVFWTRVEKQPGDGCWNWTGSLLKCGYGRVGQYDLAHRRAWTIVNGLIPRGLWVLHHCDNKRCVRPSHLFLGTHLDNVRDALSKSRYPIAHRSSKGKLTPEQTVAIHEARKNGVLCRVLSEQYGVHTSVISLIGQGRRRCLGGSR